MRKHFAKLFLISIIFSLTVTSYGAKAQLHEFATDNCTMFIDGPPRSPELWKDCCIIHDLRYWFGGSETDLDRADLRLKTCVEKKAGNTWAELIYRGVRAGHYSPIKNKYQWNWGWITPRPKTPLTKIEEELAISELRKLTYPRDFIENFINENFDLRN